MSKFNNDSITRFVWIGIHFEIFTTTMIKKTNKTKFNNERTNAQLDRAHGHRDSGNDAHRGTLNRQGIVVSSVVQMHVGTFHHFQFVITSVNVASPALATFITTSIPVTTMFRTRRQYTQGNCHFRHGIPGSP